jgi:hypothetical protein
VNYRTEAGLARASRTRTARPDCYRMSEMGHERTLVTVPFYVCFTPEIGHSQRASSMCAKCHKQTLTDT